ALAAGAFLMQFMVQGAWGVIPAHLSELAPNKFRSTFTGLAYQLGNLLASINAPLQTHIAEQHGNDYAYPMAMVTFVVLLTIALITILGREAHGIRFSACEDGTNFSREVA